MKAEIVSSAKNVLSHCYAVTATIGRSIAQSFITAFESFEESETGPYSATFGVLSDIASTSGSGYCINGTDFIRDEEVVFRNFFIGGNTGSGKSATIVSSNLLSLNGQSVIIHDPPGQTLIFAQSLIEKNYKTFVLDFSDPEHSISVNILDFVKNAADANRLTAHLVRASLGTSSSDKFWELSASSLLSLLLRLLLKLEQQYRNIANLRYMLHLFSGNPTVIDKLMAKHADDSMFAEYRGFVQSNSKTLDSIIMTCKSCLTLWDSEDICRLTSATDIDWEEFRKGRCALFIKCPTFDSVFLNSLISLILENIMRVFMSRLPIRGQDKPVSIIIDECATLNLKSLDLIVSNNRKYWLSFMLFYQNISQVYDSLGQQAGNNLLSNCFCKIFLNSTDLRTSKELEDILGKTTLIDKQGKEKLLPLLSAQAIRLLKPSEAIFLYGAKPYLLPLVPYYQQPFLAMKASKTPFQYVPKTRKSISLIPAI